MQTQSDRRTNGSAYGAYQDHAQDSGRPREIVIDSRGSDVMVSGGPCPGQQAPVLPATWSTRRPVQGQLSWSWLQVGADKTLRMTAPWPGRRPTRAGWAMQMAAKGVRPSASAALLRRPSRAQSRGGQWCPAATFRQGSSFRHPGVPGALAAAGAPQAHLAHILPCAGSDSPARACSRRAAPATAGCQRTSRSHMSSRQGRPYLTHLPAPQRRGGTACAAGCTCRCHRTRRSRCASLSWLLPAWSACLRHASRTPSVAEAAWLHCVPLSSPGC